MTYTLKMPEVGETVTEGTIERWLKQPGDEVKKYEPIVEINTDKVNVELPSPVTGTVKELIAQEGDTVKIGADLAVIDEVEGETPAELSPATPEEAERKPVAATAPAVSESRPEPPAPAREPPRVTGGRRRATPRVRTLAAELNVDLARVEGSGPGGRIVEADVRAAADGKRAEPEKAAPSRPVTAGADEEAVSLTGIRKTIAERMSASALNTPTAWLATEADVTGLVALRQAQKQAFSERYGVDLTYLPFMAHIVSQALTQHPYLNAAWGGDKIILRKRVHLAIAVATERGLLVPVVHDADRLSVSGLARAITEVAERARDNKLRLEDVQGGTFTLDNTGAFGSIISQAIINQGQSAIMTMESITKQPRVVGDDAIAVRSVVAITVTFDHRVLDGHQAGAFLQDVKRRLEEIGPESGID